MTCTVCGAPTMLGLCGPCLTVEIEFSPASLRKLPEQLRIDRPTLQDMNRRTAIAAWLEQPPPPPAAFAQHEAAVTRLSQRRRTRP